MKRVLIVEDDPKIASALTLRVKNAGYEVLLAQDAMAGVSTAVKLRPNLVLLDISMPAGSGFTVAERIQTLIPTSTPIIFLTGIKKESFREEASRLGAVGYFEKPYNGETLVAAIHQTIGDTERQAAGRISRGIQD